MEKILLILITSMLLNGCAEQEASWTNLLDRDLSQWDQYLSYKHQIGYDGQVPKDKNGNSINPIGLNRKEYGVFNLTEEKGEPILKISGEIYGCVFTKKEYTNYHLRLQVKWGEQKWNPRMNLLKDSGILYHSIGPMGAEYWKSWMLSQEFQIMEGHMGDYWSQANSAIDIRAFIPEYIMNPVADKSQPFISLGEGEKIQGFCLRSANFENSHGDWNTLELVCFEDKSIHIVNGQVVMILQNSRYVRDGKKIPLTKGRIQLQSEAAAVYFKNIQIRNLKAMPVEFAPYF
jgi:hypothetical protein